MNEIEVFRFIADKIFFAVLCGAIVGIEREMNRAHAGFKTQMLICVGAMLFTCIPQLTGTHTENTDAARIIAQIVSGVGFLGAGAIFNHTSGGIMGLTTAAWVWFTAAIGVLIGIGHPYAATLTTFTVVSVIILARKVERKMFRNRTRSSDLIHFKKEKDKDAA